MLTVKRVMVAALLIISALCACDMGMDDVDRASRVFESTTDIKISREAIPNNDIRATFWNPGPRGHMKGDNRWEE